VASPRATYIHLSHNYRTAAFYSTMEAIYNLLSIFYIVHIVCPHLRQHCTACLTMSHVLILLLVVLLSDPFWMLCCTVVYINLVLHVLSLQLFFLLLNISCPLCLFYTSLCALIFSLSASFFDFGVLTWPLSVLIVSGATSHMYVAYSLNCIYCHCLLHWHTVCHSA